MAGDLSRELLASGELQMLITGRHVVGVTTNPTIFASALAKGDRYGAQLGHLAEQGASTEAAVFTVTTDDVRAACDVLSPVYRQTAGKDGRVSIEVDPGWPVTPPQPRTWPVPCGPQWTATTCS
jgi:transaldolase